MKTREEVLALFRAKYIYLKSVYPEVGPFDENGIYQNPDGGWQINLAHGAVMMLRSNDGEPNEIHGTIYERWCKEGGAFNEAGKSGKLGYPVSDVKSWERFVQPPCPLFYPFEWNPPSTIPVRQARSFFEHGIIEYDEGLSWEKIKAFAPHVYDAVIGTISTKELDDTFDLVRQNEWPEDYWLKRESEIRNHCAEASRHYQETGMLPTDLLNFGCQHQTRVIHWEDRPISHGVDTV